MTIEDNFLGEKEFNELQTLIMSDRIDWHYRVGIDFEHENKFMFTHMFYDNHCPQSEFMETLNPIFEIIQPVSVWRTKANLLTKTPNIVENTFHVDMSFLSEEKLKQWTTSIFYINTNDGYTEFEDGTKIESIANRMITFPANINHTGTSCTDEKTSVVINFNYFK